MSSALQDYIALLQKPVPEPPLEPELDDIDQKADQQLR